MDQYCPACSVIKYEKLNRKITPSEFKEAVDYAFGKGLMRGFEECQWAINSWQLAKITKFASNITSLVTILVVCFHPCQLTIRKIKFRNNPP